MARREGVLLEKHGNIDLSRLRMDGGYQKIDKMSLPSVGGEKWPAG